MFLQDFVQGIEGSGLHGAYMVLDPSFDVMRLMKHLHIPSTVATAFKLDEKLQALLKPARLVYLVVINHHHHHHHLQLQAMNHSGALLPSNHEMNRRLLFWVLCRGEDSHRQVASYEGDRELEIYEGELRLFSGYRMTISPPLLSFVNNDLVLSV